MILDETNTERLFSINDAVSFFPLLHKDVVTSRLYRSLLGPSDNISEPGWRGNNNDAIVFVTRLVSRVDWIQFTGLRWSRDISCLQ